MYTEYSTVKSIKKDSLLKAVVPYLIYNNKGDGAGNLKDEFTLADIQKKNPTWGAKDMAYGLNCLVKNVEAGVNLVYTVYSEEEIKECPKKECVKLIYFPADKVNKSKPNRFAILAAGGAYGAVCSISEAFPVAAKLNELGIDVFCLNYRVADVPPLFPKPMEDLAAAYRFLTKNADKFGIDLNHYAVGGFSAGGHLAATWGLKELGYSKFEFAKPDLMLLDYPMINIWRTVGAYPNPIRGIMMGGYIGKDYTEDACRPYNIDESMDALYPATFIIQAENDNTIPVWNSYEFAEKLKQLGVPCQSEHPNKCGHGFGLGSDTEAEGWVEQAVDFWNKITMQSES